MLSTEFFFFDEEDEEKQDLRVIRRRLRDSSNPLEINNRVFIQNFRISKEIFSFILKEIDGKIRSKKTKRAVPNIIKLTAALKFFAQGSYQLGVGNDFNLGLAQPTVSIIIREILNVIEKYICPKAIKFCYTENEERRAKLYFYEKSQIPNVIGAIDGSHIKIIAPKADVRHAYYNRKGFYSLNALIVCDDQMLIKYVDATYPGSYHDSNIWKMSNLKAKLEYDYKVHKRETKLLGDSGYPLLPYLLTPYRNVEEGSAQRRFNIQHAKGRVIVERCIGLLKGRFRCLLEARELHYSPEKAVQITNVCAALHNLCIKFKMEVDQSLIMLDEDNNERNITSEETTSSTDNLQLLEARRIRDNLLKFM